MMRFFKNIRQAKYSLKAVLVLGFLVFTVTPLVLITLFSISKYKEVIENELEVRLENIHAETSRYLRHYMLNLEGVAKVIQEDKPFIYYMVGQSKSRLEQQFKNLVGATNLDEVYFFSRDGALVMSFLGEGKDLRRNKKLEKKDYSLSSDFLNSSKLISNKKSHVFYIDHSSKDKIVFKVISNLLTERGRLVGFSQLNYELNIDRVMYLKSATGADIYMTSANSSASSPHLHGQSGLATFKNSLGSRFFPSSRSFKAFEDDNLQMLFLSDVVDLNGQKISLSVGLSQKPMFDAVHKINQAFLLTVGGLMIFLLLLYGLTTRVLLSPMDSLLSAIKGMKAGHGNVLIENIPSNELGIVIENFNDMSRTLSSTQTQLVHQAKMASLGQLVAGVAHELNNPIGYIYANMSHLRDYAKSLFKIIDVAKNDPKGLDAALEEEDYNYIREDLPKLIKSCEEGARRTKGIVLGLRNFSRLDEEQLKLTNLQSDIENTLKLLSGELKNRIQIIRDYGDGVPEVMAYPSQLNQVLMNVIANAAQAIEGEGQIRITLKNCQNNPDRDGALANEVLIQVADTGRGMSEEVKSRIFDPFYTTKEVGKGTGLGLSISFGIIENHKGRIVVDSKPNEGTTFSIYLPINL